MALKFKKNVEKLIDFSVESQFKREGRLRGHVSSFFAASSIVLVAETTLFSVLSAVFYDICSFLWYISITLLVLQVALIVICYFILFPGMRISIGSPKVLFKWYEDNHRELEHEQEEGQNGKTVNEEETELKMLKAESNMYEDIYNSVKKDVDTGFRKLRIIQIVSVILVAAFVHITLLMCFLKIIAR